jgi:hypothetical protein
MTTLDYILFVLKKKIEKKIAIEKIILKKIKT